MNRLGRIFAARFADGPTVDETATEVLAGQPYLGKARLFGRDYMTKYMTFCNTVGRVSGILFIGIELTDGLRDLKEKTGTLQYSDKPDGNQPARAVEQAEQAVAQLNAMVPTIGRTSAQIQGIAQVSSQQPAGVGQINAAMTRLNQATQQNAAASEQLAATAEKLGVQAENRQQTRPSSSPDDSAAPATPSSPVQTHRAAICAPDPRPVRDARA